MAIGRGRGFACRRGRAGGTRALVVVLLLFVCLASRASAGGTDRRPGESVPEYAQRLLPTGSELATRPVDLTLGSLGKVIVVLFTPANEEANYTGWVMVPQGTDGKAYRKAVLPPLTAASGLFDIEVKSIFSADVDGDGSPELCVLSRYYRNGSAEKAYPATDCFHSTGQAFELVKASGPATVGLSNAKAVRRHFARHPIKSDSGLPQSTPP